MVKGVGLIAVRGVWDIRGGYLRGVILQACGGWGGDQMIGDDKILGVLVYRIMIYIFI